jgi:hypothetical protein
VGALMTALGDLSQTLEVPEAGLADKAVSTRKSIFNTHSFYGVGGSSGNVTVFPHTIRATTTLALELNHVPAYDVWWDVRALIGYLQKVDAAMHYQYVYMVCDPTPVATLANMRYLISEQKADSNNYMMTRSVQSLFALTGGVAYRVNVYLGSGTGGTWLYWLAYNHIIGKSWAR